jgi:hypothetical protein
MSSYFVLDANGDPQPVDVLTWAEWFETADRIVQQTRIVRGRAVESPRSRRGVSVSTVFLGMDMAFTYFPPRAGAPVLWETMIFGGALDGDQWRYRSKPDALAGHAAAVARALAVGPRVPRKLKIALAKRARSFTRRTPRETRRLARFDARVST